MKTFNTTGVCRPNEHYMVDITERLEIIRRMIAKGDYFCINRGRQYGKTTTLEALTKYVKEDYCVFSISFEGMAGSCYADEEKLYASLVYKMAETFEWVENESLDKEVAKQILSFTEAHEEKCDDKQLSKFISTICHSNAKPMVLLIDEVDQAGNYPSFLKLLALLRRMYLKKNVVPTFQSIILAGVYDVKNLKLKIRSDEDHQYNSPWNIAVPFDIDMSLPADGIARMLDDYANEHDIQFDTTAIGQLIYNYTSGYPFLVSRLCQIIDAENYGWDKDGVLRAVNDILMERNTLFDNMIKKLDDYPELKLMLKSILMTGCESSYNPDEKSIQIATMLSYIVNKNGKVVIACRIMETRLYNLFIKEEENSVFYRQGQIDKNQFIKDGTIDMKLLLERFVVHMNQTYKMDFDNEFVENDARKIFLTYLRPIINGTGNYYCEAQTRDLTRTDVIVDYLGQQYVIELKIWRGEAYNERGEQQLAEYLDYYHLDTGYMLSFCFNKNKQPGIHEVKVGDRTIIEAVV